MCQKERLMPIDLIAHIRKSYSDSNQMILELIEDCDHCLICSRNATCDRPGYGESQLMKGILPINN